MDQSVQSHNERVFAILEKLDKKYPTNCVKKMPKKMISILKKAPEERKVDHKLDESPALQNVIKQEDPLSDTGDLEMKIEFDVQESDSIKCEVDDEEMEEEDIERASLLDSEKSKVIIDKYCSKILPYCSICKCLFPTMEEKLLHWKHSHPQEKMQVFCRFKNCEYSDVNANNMKNHIVQHLVAKGNLVIGKILTKQIQKQIKRKKQGKEPPLTHTLTTPHEDNKDFLCLHCGVSMGKKQRKAIYQHIDKCNGCNLCDFKTNNREDFLSHVQSVHKGKQFQCPSCPIQFTNEPNLNRHVEAAHKGGMFKCSECDYQAKRKTIVDEHFQVVHEGIKFQCPKCEYQANGKQQLLYHISKFHESSVKNEAIKSSLCPHCGHQASSNANLHSHIKAIHEGVKYPCPHCPYQATQKSSLQSHINAVHMRQKGHLCPHCGFEATKTILRQHIQTMHEAPKFLCSQCDYKTPRKAHLDIHIKTVHEGLTFPCPQCDYKATRKHNLKVHIQTVHEGLKFNCQHCDYQATRADYVQKHINSDHPELIDSG